MLAGAGIEYDDRPYHAHVTLVRDARAPAVLPSLRFDWLVREFALIESGRDPRGAPDEGLAFGSAGEGDDDPFAGFPRPGDFVLGAVILQRFVDLVRGPQQRQLP